MTRAEIRQRKAENRGGELTSLEHRVLLTGMQSPGPRPSGGRAATASRGHGCAARGGRLPQDEGSLCAQ